MTASIEFNGRDLLVTPPRFPSEEVKLDLGGRWGQKEFAKQHVAIADVEPEAEAKAV